MHFYNFKKGFTLVELLVAIAIFTVMTSILVVKYGGFSEGMTLTNLAYDIALTLREAQSYGINVSDEGNLTGSRGQFNTAYGVYFVKSSNNNLGVDTTFRLYGDYDARDTNGRVGYSGGVENIRVMTMKNGNKIESLCVKNSEDGTCSPVLLVDIQFKRPDPSPVIYGSTVTTARSKYNHAEIGVVSPNGSRRKVVVRTSGQISVEESSGIQKR